MTTATRTMALDITQSIETMQFTVDHEATFADAYRSYYPKILSFIYRRVGSYELAEDLTSETFEKAYVKGRDLVGAATYTTWLYTVARNVVIDHYRRQKRAVAGMQRIEESLRTTEPVSDPEEMAIHNDMAQEVASHMRSLSLRDRTLIQMKFQDGLSYEEIAQVLQTSVPNVRVSVCRALKKLRMQFTASNNLMAI